MSDSKELKAILQKLLDEIESLQANQVVLSQQVGVQMSIADAQEAKNLALHLNGAHFDKLRLRIEGLA